jgi:carboxyl-terminal processing protease
MMAQRQLRTMKLTLAFASALLLTAPVSAFAQETVDQNNLVREVLGQYHVSGVTTDALKGKTIDEMIKSLNDPYTVFFSDEEYKQFGNSIENNYVGMGGRIARDESGVYVSEVFVGSPAEKAGIQRDDYINAIDGVAVPENAALDYVVSRIVGEPGSKVTVTVLRAGSPMNFTVSRGAVNISEVNSKMLNGGTGYIQVTDFSSDADEDFAAQLSALQAKDMKSLIIDLRNNPGGLLQTALHISQNFIKEGTLIHTRDRNGVDMPTLIANGKSVGVPVYILLNENSASASEVLSGALQDYGVAKVIGVQSYGKGSVQQLLELDGGGALKVTIQEYLTPNLHKVNKVGITPDMKVEGGAAQMITALHQTGIQDVTVQISKHRVKLNNTEINDSFNIIKENGHIYAPARALAALINAPIAWNDTLRTVEISGSKGKSSFPIQAEVLQIQNGTSYVNVDAFSVQFPQLETTATDDLITIHAGKGN